MSNGAIHASSGADRQRREPAGHSSARAAACLSALACGQERRVHQDTRTGHSVRLTHIPAATHTDTPSPLLQFICLSKSFPSSSSLSLCLFHSFISLAYSSYFYLPVRPRVFLRGVGRRILSCLSLEKF